MKNHPGYCEGLFFCEAAVLDAIRSATASAWARSSLPFKKARWVNSPGFAGLAPAVVDEGKQVVEEKKEEDENKVFEKVEVEASFKGGEREWRKYLERNLEPNVPVENGANEGTYTVTVQFIVDKEGKISDVKALSNHGHGMEEEAIRVIKKGPDWVPAIQNGRNVKAYRKQPITFVVAAE